MNVQGQMDFVSVGENVLAYLQQHYPLGLWMISRVNHNDLVVLQLIDKAFNVKPGMTFNWEDTLCVRMLTEVEPNVAPNIDDIPLYRQAPIAVNFDIKACISVPIYSNNQLFGTVCGVHKTSLDPSISAAKADIENQATLLGKALEHDFAALDQIRQQERLSTEPLTDPLTLIPDWRGWDVLLDAEQLRCKTYGNKGIIVSVDIADLKVINQTHSRETGDKILKQTADILKSLVRPHDIVARVGNDEFGVLCIDHPTLDANNLAKQVKEALKLQNIHCYVGHATSLPQKGLREAWEMAEHMMYKEKKLSKFKN